jgi:hypothetical protein
MKDNKQRIGEGDKTTYLISLLLTPLSSTVWVEILSTNTVNFNFIWLESSWTPNILTIFIYSKIVGLR